MNRNGPTTGSDAQVLTWPKRLLCADDLRRHLDGQRELRLLPRTIVTPLAADELRARGIRITHASAVATQDQQPAAAWSFVPQAHDPLVVTAVEAVRRDGVHIAALPPMPVRDVAGRVSSGASIILFCGDPALACCIANKHAGLRAAPVLCTAHAVKARASLAPNLYAVEMPGRTFFELRQILRTIAAAPAVCPAPLATILQELDGHAHR